MILACLILAKLANSPNSPKFPPAKITRYTVVEVYYILINNTTANSHVRHSALPDVKYTNVLATVDLSWAVVHMYMYMQ